MKRLVILFFAFTSLMAFGQDLKISGTVNVDDMTDPKEIELLLIERNEFKTLSKNKRFEFDSLSSGTYTIRVFSPGYENLLVQIKLVNSDSTIQIHLKKLSSELGLVEIQDKKDNDFGIARLKPVEGTAIYAGKKSEVILMEDMAVNKATNNSRQIFSKVSGLNIWENDAAGIQLGIGGRGLNPNRVSNFNTRQNGYDISADALGYPESYYSPSAEAIDRIEIVRGAAALQYGTQFGGFINFKLKEGPADTIPFEVLSRQSVGSYNLFNSFNSIGGNYKKLKYYAYFQHKQGDSWRPNAHFDVNSAHSHLTYAISSRLNLDLEYTYMHYLAQQPGGLTDRQFDNDPQQSIRARNWFEVNWNLAAINLDYKIASQTDFNSRVFGLIASRNAVGNLGQITRVDAFGTPRDLLKDQYKNYGIENRLIHRYSFLKNTSIFLIGMRFYSGHTDRKQGEGSSGRDASFSLTNESNPEDSDYEFPSQNLAFFTENVFYLSPKLSLTPGLRFEYISTESEGYYVNRSSNLAGQTIFEEKIQDNRSNARSFLLAGLGLSYKYSESLELYSNFSQNYRSINFNDMRIVNDNYQVDPDLQDEKGFSFDFGLRGNKNNFFNYDFSFFLLQYENRIGEVRIVDPLLFRPIRYRTNVSDSRTYGLESFAELSFLPLFGLKKTPHQITAFINYSWMKASYINSKETAFEGKSVELVPEVILKTGAAYRYKKLKLSYQFSFTEEHYTDATNADFTSNAVDGLIPSYAVMDLALAYSYKHWILETGLNNLRDTRYFTRRASGYPGPGIIPAEPRTYYLCLGLKF